MRGIERQIGEFNAAGIRPVAISVDSPEQNAEIARIHKISFPILSDSDGTAIRTYDLVHTGAGEDGRDIARPAEFLIDTSGTVRWVNLTENYWVRATPEQVLEAAKLLQ